MMGSVFIGERENPDTLQKAFGEKTTNFRQVN
jgi:hypothetical protein